MRSPGQVQYLLIEENHVGIFSSPHSCSSSPLKTSTFTRTQFHPHPPKTALPDPKQSKARRREHTCVVLFFSQLQALEVSSLLLLLVSAFEAAQLCETNSCSALSGRVSLSVMRCPPRAWLGRAQRLHLGPAHSASSQVNGTPRVLRSRAPRSNHTHAGESC